MNNKKTLKKKIVQSIFIYETKRMTVDTILKLLILFASIGIILIFGGVITDLFVEGEMGELLRDFIYAKEYSYSKILELNSVMSSEIPNWLIVSCIGGLLLGCILVTSVIKNRKSIFHKISSIVHYWFKL